MPITMLDQVEFGQIPTLNFVVPVVVSDPTGYKAGLIFNDTSKELKYHNGTSWVAVGLALGPAGGDLSGTYPNPQIAAGVIVDADVNATANIAQTKIAGLTTALTGKAATTTALTAGAGLTGGGDLSANRSFDVGQGTGILVAADAISLDTSYTDSKYEEVFVGPAAPPINQQIWIDTDDPDPVVDNTPSGPAGGDLTGTYPNPTIKADVIVDADVNTTANIAQSKIANLVSDLAAKAPNSALANYQPLSAKGVANGYAPLDASNLIPTAHIPPLAINDVFVVASEAAMLALTAQVGDMAIRTDTNKTYVLSASPASTLANWKEIMATGQVVSVNGSTGVVTITLASLGGVATTRNVVAGSGLTGGGTLAADITLNVGAGSGILVAADALSVDTAVVEVVSRKGAASGYPSLDGSAKVPIAQVPTGTTSSTVALGDHLHTGIYVPIANAPKRYAADLGAITGGTGLVVTHSLGTKDLTVSVFRIGTPFDVVQCGIEMTSTTTITLKFSTSYAASTFRVVVQG